MWLKTRLKRVLGVLAALVLAIGMMPTGSAVANIAQVFVRYTVAPATAVPGSEDVPFMYLYLDTDATSDTLQQLTVQFTGDSAADVTQVKLYESSTLRQSVPLVDGKAVFTVSVPVFPPLNLLKVLADISPGATPGHTVALTVEPGGFVFQKSGAVPFTSTASQSVTVQAGELPPTNLPLTAFTSFPQANSANIMWVKIRGTAPSSATVHFAISDAGGVHTIAYGLYATLAGDWETSVDLSTFNDGPLTASTYVRTDAADKVTAVSSKDTVKPDPPALTAVSAVVDNVSQAAMVIDGTAEAGATVNVTITANGGGTPMMDQQIAAGGTFSFREDVSGLGDGMLTLKLTATDVAGNTSAEFAHSVLKDTGVGTPTLTLIDGPVNASNYTGWKIGGKAGPGTTIDVSVASAAGGGPVTDNRIVDSTGVYAFTLNLSTLTEGNLTVLVTQTDAVGTTSTVTKPTIMDIEYPVQPYISLFQDATFSNPAVLPISGTGGSNENVTIIVKGGGLQVTKTVTADATGQWATTVDVSALPDGGIGATATSIDEAGNSSTTPFGWWVTKDTGVPGAPSNVEFWPVNNNAKIAARIDGRAEPGTRVDIDVTDVGAAHTAHAQVTSDSRGEWRTSVDLSAFSDGTLTASVKAADAVFNWSPVTVINSVLDTVVNPPAASTVHFPPLVNTANKAAVTFTGDGGSAEPGATVFVVVRDAASLHYQSFTTTANADGSWSTALNLSVWNDGALDVQIWQIDVARNYSGPLNVTMGKDTVVPTIAVAAVGFKQNATVNPTYQYYAWNRPATITATASEPVTWSWAVKDRFGNTVATSSTAVASSSLSVDWAPAQYAASGNYTITLSATDLALYPVAAPVTLTIPVYNYDFRILGTRLLNGSMTPTATATAGMDYHVEVSIENLNPSAGIAYTVFQERQGAVRAFSTAAQEVPGGTVAAFTFLWRPTSGSTEIDFFVWNQLALSDRGARSADYHTTIAVN